MLPQACQRHWRHRQRRRQSARLNVVFQRGRKKARKTVNLLASRRFANLARRLYTLVAEVTELTEKADNVLRVTEDVYLARVYLAALGLFRVPTVSASVQRKLAIVRDTYAALFDEAWGARGELLELAIILLIVIEIAIALLRHVS